MAKLKRPPTPRADVQAKFVRARQAMASALIERDEEVDLVLTALLANEHPLLVGPPGSAKSLLLDSLRHWVAGSKFFSILMTKYTVPEEVFGPISVNGLKEDKYRRITTNRLPQAELAFLDEIFKASSAILNTTLRILNERLFEDGEGGFKKCPLLMCVAASNEFPHDQDGGKELGALFDRFLIRKKVGYIRTRGGRDRLLWDRNLEPEFQETISIEEIVQAQEEAKALFYTESATKCFERILDALETEGIRPGDRRIRKSVGVCRAYAYLVGHDRVEQDDLVVLSHTLWDDPTEQPEKAARIVGKLANPTAWEINRVLQEAESVVRSAPPTDAVEKLKSLERELDSLPDGDRKDTALAVLSQLVKDSYDRVIGRPVR
jgi:MoxR-like ATPase